MLISGFDIDIENSGFVLLAAETWSFFVQF